ATSWFVARELETGALSQANPYVTPDDPSAVNAYLQQATGGQVLAGTHLPQVALGLIEEAARDAQLGGDPWIHIPVRLVPLLGDVLTQAGGLLTTKTGARVVADSGYSGDGPEEATGTWLYATGPVQVRLSAIDTTEYVDHETNVITRTASRLFAATFDPCTLHAVQISVPEPAA
ncbi:MAG TPA: hypothetical protein VHH52_03100, partial [Pseudonocardiaceae bacterium]|nr:hypothetical protein [Pseudonocardiaceae bacterium]